MTIGNHGISETSSFGYNVPKTPPDDLFEDDNRYFESVSVDIEQDELK